MEESKKKLIVIGAGPAGLTAALTALRESKGNVVPVVLEKNTKYVGGISKTVDYKGYKFDIGGHRFFSKSKEVTDFWETVGGEDLLERPRLSRIYYKGKFFDYPIKPMNAFINLGPFVTFQILVSYLKAKLFPVKDPKSFEDYVSNQFGKKLYSIFFKSYTEKVWGIPCSQLSADWAAQRIKGLTLSSLAVSTLKSVLGIKEKKVIKTLIEKFKYSKEGPGQLWEEVASLIEREGGEVTLDRDIVKINYDSATKKIVSVTAKDREGKEYEYSGDYFISTMPIRELVSSLEPKPLKKYIKASQALNYRDFFTVVLIADQEFVFEDNWIYIHEPNVKLGRIQNFKNWSPYMVPDKTKTSLGMEYFCNEGDEMWNKPNEELIELAKDELEKIGLATKDKIIDGTVFRMSKAYPVYDENYKENIQTIREFTDQIDNLYLVGRNGMHKYNNQDHSMMTGMIAVRKMLGNKALDPWNVNSDAEYHEIDEKK